MKLAGVLQQRGDVVEENAVLRKVGYFPYHGFEIRHHALPRSDAPPGGRRHRLSSYSVIWAVTIDRSFCNAAASIWRTRSRVSSSTCPISSSVCRSPPP